jgi:hypothetical protein
MQNGLRLMVALSVLGITFFSCKEEELQSKNDNIPTVETKLSEFKGESVRVPVNFPDELFYQSDADFEQYYTSFFQSGNGKVLSDVSLTLPELIDVIEPYKRKYPDLNIEKDITERDLEIIYRDFPSIHSVDEIREKSDIIGDFYQAILRSEVIPVIVQETEKRGTRNARTTGYDFGQLGPHEQMVISQNPNWVQAYGTAAGTAHITVGGSDDTKTNAKKHSSWNALIIRFVILVGASKENAIEYAKKGTSAHEKTVFGEQIHSPQAAMDLSNNKAGRTWMSQQTGWGFLGARKMPTEAQIFNTMGIRANVAHQYSNDVNGQNGILFYHNNDWNEMYNGDQGYQELVYLLD